jgi:hypothetical protein
MKDDDSRGYWDGRGLVLLWLSILAGPVAAAVNLQLGYALVKWACSTRHVETLIIMTIGALATAVVGAAIGWWCLEKIGAHALSEGGRRIDRGYFLAGVSIGFNLLLILLNLMWTVPTFVLSPCE